MRGSRAAVIRFGRAGVHSALAPQGGSSGCRPEAAAALLPQRRHFSRQSYGGYGFNGFGGQAPPRGNTSKYYDLLGVERSATEADIKSAYKKQAMQHHPDRGGDEAKFKEISRAYEVLSDKDKRQVYDTYGEDGLNNMDQMGGGGGGAGPGVDPFELFSQMFGFSSGQARRGKPRTPDSSYELKLTLEEMYEGTSRNITFNREALCKTCDGFGGTNVNTCPKCKGSGVEVVMQQAGVFVQHMTRPCDHCKGQGYVIPPGNICGTCNGRGTTKEKKNFNIDITPGVQEGVQFRFRGEADEAPGHDTGDVVITVRAKPHPTFVRARDSLVMTKKVSLAEALCGFEVHTKFLDGKDLVLRSEPGNVVSPGDMLVVEGKGMPRPHGQRPGHLFLIVDVEFPDRLDESAQKALTEALGAPPLSDVPPPGAESPRKLSRRQAQEIQQTWRQSAGQQAGGVHQCAQQ